MDVRLLLAVGLVLVGAVVDSPPAILLGLAAVLVEAVALLWTRRGLSGVEYRRTLLTDRVSCGDEIPLDVTIWNRKNLPLAWLEAMDVATAGVRVRERALVGGPDGTEVLRNAWSLAPYEKVVRHYHLLTDRRGVFGLGPVHLRAGDLFARPAAEAVVAGRARYLVRPRTVRVASAVRDERWGGDLRARLGLLEDPALFAGVRDYQPGDPLRRIHWKASARIGRPVSKRFEPAREREIVVALDIQTASGPAWQTAFVEELVEELCVAAGSLVRRLVAEGASVGMAAAGYSFSTQRFAYLPPAATGDQVGRCLDQLARLSPFPSAPFERLLGSISPRLRPGTTLVILSGRDPGPFLPALRRVVQSGFSIRYVALGPGAGTWTRRVRAAGISAHAAALDGSWRTATELRVGAA